MGAPAEGRHDGSTLLTVPERSRREACPYLVIESHKVGSYKRRNYGSKGNRSMGILPMLTGRMPVPQIP